MTTHPDERRLLVSARQVARFWGVTPIAVRQASDTGLLTPHRTADGLVLEERDRLVGRQILRDLGVRSTRPVAVDVTYGRA